MYLSEVKIKNFRLFQSLDLKFNRGLNVLVGGNDAGKTALVDAVRYALGTNSNDRAYIAEQDFFNDTTELSIRVKFSDVDKHAYRFVEHLSYEEYKTDKGELKQRSVLYVHFRAWNTNLERRGYPYIKTDVRSGVDGNGRSIEPDIRSFLSTTYLKPLRDATAELSSGRTSRLSQVLSSSKDVCEGMGKILKTIADANNELIADDAPLKKAAKKIEKEYLHNLIFDSDKSEMGAYIDIAGVKGDELGSIPDHVKKRHFREILERLSLALTADRKGHGLGYQNLLFMAAELLLLEQSSNEEFSLLLIEEPEAHLHPQLQMKLLQFINSKLKTSKNPDGVQCLLTTHSPNLSSKADPSEIIMMKDGYAWSLRPGETELIADDYKYLRKFLDATKANIFFAKGIMLVEGAAEHILLPEIAKLLGRPLENFGVSIVKYDNSGSWKRFARLFLRENKDGDEDKKAWHPTKICVLRDVDLWPDCAEEGCCSYGFKKEFSGNSKYWHKNCVDEGVHRATLIDGLCRQNVLVKISDDWTFEYCLAKDGLFKECTEALGEEFPDDASSSVDEKATWVMKHVSKTDFAYKFADILQKQLNDKIQERGSKSEEDVKLEFADNLRGKLPKYILEAIDYVTGGDAVEEEQK